MVGAGGVVKKIGSFCTDESVSIIRPAFIDGPHSQEIQDQVDFWVTSHELGHRSDSLFSTGISIMTPTSSSDSKSSYRDCMSTLSAMPSVFLSEMNVFQPVVLWELLQDHVTWHESSFLFNQYGSTPWSNHGYLGLLPYYLHHDIRINFESTLPTYIQQLLCKLHKGICCKTGVSVYEFLGTSMLTNIRFEEKLSQTNFFFLSSSKSKGCFFPGKRRNNIRCHERHVHLYSIPFIAVPKSVLLFWKNTWRSTSSSACHLDQTHKRSI